MKTKIYSLQDEYGNIRYIGKTSKSIKERFSGHLREAKKGVDNHRCNWIRSVMARGKWPIVFLIGEVDGDGCKEEIAWIKYFREEGVDLVNETNGGDGQSKGYKPSDVTCRKISEGLKGKKGRHHPETTKRKMSLAHGGNGETKIYQRLLGLRNKKSRFFSPEHRRKLREARKGKTPFKGKHHSQEVIKARTDKLKGMTYHHSEKWLKKKLDKNYEL